KILDECAQFMIDRIRIGTVFKLLNFFRAISYDKIERLLRYVDINFVPISNTEEFLEISVNDLEYLLQRDSLNIDDECQVFEALSRWIGQDDMRKQFAARFVE
ncbi:hypothetical protein PMAYCL1PPCAC_03278, partial [Pristionchus mayeri]